MSGSTGHGQATRRRIAAPRVLTTCGALGVAAGLSIAGVALTSSPAHAATTTKLAYNCKAPAINLTFTDAWSVTVQTDYPASVSTGEALHTSYLNAQVTAGDDAATQFRAIGVGSWSGSVKLSYAVAGAVATPGDRSSTLTVDTTTLPATGPITTDANGTAADEKAAATAGTATVTAGNLTATLTTDSGVPVELDCALADGQNATIAGVAVTGASASSSTSPTSTPTSTPTGTATSPTTGPPIITDGDSSGGNATGALIGAGIAAAGVTLFGVGSARRLRTKRS